MGGGAGTIQATFRRNRDAKLQTTLLKASGAADGVAPSELLSSAQLTVMLKRSADRLRNAAEAGTTLKSAREMFETRAAGASATNNLAEVYPGTGVIPALFTHSPRTFRLVEGGWVRSYLADGPSLM